MEDSIPVSTMFFTICLGNFFPSEIYHLLAKFVYVSVV